MPKPVTSDGRTTATSPLTVLTSILPEAAVVCKRILPLTDSASIMETGLSSTAMFPLIVQVFSSLLAEQAESSNSPLTDSKSISAAEQRVAVACPLTVPQDNSEARISDTSTAAETVSMSISAKEPLAGTVIVRVFFVSGGGEIDAVLRKSDFKHGAVQAITHNELVGDFSLEVGGFGKNDGIGFFGRRENDFSPYPADVNFGNDFAYRRTVNARFVCQGIRF